MFAGEPLHRWRDERVRLSSLLDQHATQGLIEALARTDEAGQIELLSALASRRLRAAGGTRASVARLAQRIGDGEPISMIARSLSMSPRHLLRHCNDVFGMPPSTLRKILRLHRVARRRAIGRRGGLAAVAATEGYADESHLARDVRSLTLTTLRVASSHPVRFVQDTASAYA